MMLLLSSAQQLEPEVALALAVGGQFLLTMVVLGLQTWRLVKKEPPLHEVYATKKEVSALRAGTDHQFEKLEARISKNAVADEARAEAIHERVNLILASVSRIEGACRSRQRDGGCQ